MYLLTQDFQDTPYFTSFNPDQLNLKAYGGRHMTLTKSSSQTLLQFKQPVNLIEEDGLSLLVVTHDPDRMETYRFYQVAGGLQIKAGTYFNTLSLTDNSQILLITQQVEPPRQVVSPKNFGHDYKFLESKQLKPISLVYTQLESLENRSLPFPNFWTLLVMDQGSLRIRGKQISVNMESQQMMILPPFQSLKVENQEEASSCIWIPFEGDELLSDKLLLPQAISLEELTIIKTLNQSFESSYMSERDDLAITARFQLLILSLLKQDRGSDPALATTSMQMNVDSERFEEIDSYIKSHYYQNIQVSDLVDRFGLSRSTLQSLFRQYRNMTPKQYITHLRLERSKELIRESTYSLSEIANNLGFGSIQYFSRCFKKAYNISPSAYAKKSFHTKD